MLDAQPTVFVVDHDSSVRESLESLIRGAGWRSEVFASAPEFLWRPRSAGASCLVLDLDLPGLNGLDLQERVADRVDMPIIFLTGCGDVRTSVRALKAGAIDILPKPPAVGELLNAIRAGLDRSRAMLGFAEEVQALRSAHDQLTLREREVMTLVVAGLLNKQVGGRLGISEITVKAHRGGVMRKMHATSFAELVKMAVRLQIIGTWKTEMQNYFRTIPAPAVGTRSDLPKKNGQIRPFQLSQQIEPSPIANSFKTWSFAGNTIVSLV